MAPSVQAISDNAHVLRVTRVLRQRRRGLKIGVCACRRWCATCLNLYELGFLHHAHQARDRAHQTSKQAAR